MNDNTFDALANEQRRALLLALLESKPQGARIGPRTGAAASTVSPQRVQTSMYHSHLPKLEAYGYIEWHRDTHEVVTGPRFEEIRPLLEYVDGHTGNADRSGRCKP